VVIQAERMDDGRRRIVSIAEIIGMEEDVVTMQEIYRFRRVGRAADGSVLGEFETTGVRPKFMEELTARGIELPPGLFAPHKRSA
jgi:pilus assembly protein CpaF